MDSVALWFDDEEAHDQNERVQRRLLRSKSDILSLNAKSFIKNFRLSQEAFIYFLNNIGTELNTTKLSVIPPIIKISGYVKIPWSKWLPTPNWSRSSSCNISASNVAMFGRSLRSYREDFMSDDMSEDEKKEAKTFFK